VACIDAGKHVLIEKPLANTEPECLDIIAAADRSGVVAMHGYVMRYAPIVCEFGRLLREKVYGDCFHLSIWTEQYTDRSRGEWIGQVAEVGGGQLFSHGCHYIDLLLHWMGRPETGTHVGTNLGTPWMEMEGTSNVAMSFAGGATAYHFGTWGARGSRLRYSFHAHCTLGMLELDYGAGDIVLWVDPSHGDLGGMSREEMADAKSRPRSRVVHHVQDTHKHTEAEVGHFLACIAQGRAPETDLRSGLQSLRTIWRLYDAEQRGIVADLRGLGLGEFSPEPDRVLAERRRFGYTCDRARLFAG
jgi:predicted dehydrogenase